MITRDENYPADSLGGHVQRIADLWDEILPGAGDVFLADFNTDWTAKRDAALGRIMRDVVGIELPE